MPQFVSPFTIKDGSGTPADVTYTPELLSSAETILVDRRLPSRDQNPSITVSFARPVPQRPSYKQELEVVYPIVRNVNGVDLVRRPLRARLVLDLSTESTEQERAHLHAAIRNAAAHALIVVGATKLDPLY